MQTSEINVIRKVEMDIQLFEDIFHFLSALRMFPEVWKVMNIEKHKDIMSRIEPTYDKINETYANKD